MQAGTQGSSPLSCRHRTSKQDSRERQARKQRDPIVYSASENEKGSVWAGGRERANRGLLGCGEGHDRRGLAIEPTGIHGAREEAIGRTI